MDPDAYMWIRLRAAETLAKLGNVGDKNSVHNALTKLMATTKTSTLEKEANEAGAAGYHVVGMTIAKTAIGGKEAVVIARRAVDR